jgi:nifR3 family TIM-barrel protein
VLRAPLAGWTDLPFRRQAAAFGARYTVSEMTACDALASARIDMMRRTAGQGRISPLVIQLAGREPEWMARGAALAEDCGADVIDINMGCPAKAVTSGQSGSALMREPELALRLIEAVVGATRLPVTLKMRLGWCPQSRNAAELARRAQAAGVRMIVVHARTRQDFFKGKPDWAAVRPVTDATDLPVIVNGDIKGASSARTALALSGAAGVMVGRGAAGRPWLIKQIEAALAGHAASEPDVTAQAASLLELLEDSLELYGPALGVRVARKHIAAYLDHAPLDVSDEERVRLRRRLCTLNDPSAVREGVRNAYAQARRSLAA